MKKDNVIILIKERSDTMGWQKEIKYFQYYGAEIKEHIDTMARFRLEQFKEYPYLYVGDYGQEQVHLGSYANYRESSLILAAENDKVVAISTSLPLKYEEEVLSCCAEELERMGMDATKGYYFGETIILPEYRSQGIGSTIVNMQEEYARTLGCTFVCFIAVQREPDHPLRPKDYVEAAIIFERLGFKKTESSISFSWPTIQADGAVREQGNLLDFWIKRL